MILKVSALNAYYGNIHALKGVNLEINEGEIVALIGSNGAGKSTTLATIAGLMKSAPGSKVEYMGKNITNKEPHSIVESGISLVPEGREIFPGLSVSDNLRLGAYTRSDKKEIGEAYKTVYELFPRLEERKKQTAGTLSGGEQQMLAIGRALMCQPKLLLLDEPSLGLAPNIVQNIFRMIRQINERGVTVLLVEQNANMALRIAHRGYILETGKITMSDESHALSMNDDVRKAYLSNAYYLAKRGMKIVLIEKGDLAAGTTSRSDGDNFVCDAAPGFTTEFTVAAVHLIGELSKVLNYDIDWLEKGALMLAETEAEFEVARKIYEEKSAAGVKVRLMDQKEVHDDEPNTAPDIFGALEFSEGGSLSPMLLAFALGEHIKAMGGELLRYTKVTGFGFEKDGSVAKVITDQGEIHTPRIVLAAGIWSAELAKLAGLDIPVTPMKGDLLVVEPGAHITRRKTMELGYALVRNEDNSVERAISPFMKAHGVGFLVEPTGSHNALIGFSKYPADTISNNHMVIRAIAKRAMRFFPCLAQMNIIRTYAGLRPWTPDHEAIVSETKIPGFYLCTGHCGNGITNGPLSAKCLAQLMFGEPTDFDMSKLSLARFESR